MKSVPRQSVGFSTLRVSPSDPFQILIVIFIVIEYSFTTNDTTFTKHRLIMIVILILIEVQAAREIEENTLSLEQVMAVLSGRRVFGQPREIQEVRSLYRKS